MTRQTPRPADHLVETGRLGAGPDDEPALQAVIDVMTAIASTVGQPDFYRRILAALAALFGCERRLAMRYAQFARPQFLVNASIDEQAERYYDAELYRYDPLLKLVRGQVDESVVTLRRLEARDETAVYIRDLFRTTEIVDELAFLLPVVGGVWVGLCLDRTDRDFSAAELSFGRRIYPLLDQLHRLHVDRGLSRRRGGLLDDSELGVMIRDAEGYITFRNDVWHGRAGELDGRAIDISHAQPQGEHSISDTEVLHWEALAANHAIAPTGTLYVLERRSPGLIEVDSDRLIDRFAREFHLTRREVQIVRMTLLGRSPQAIADAFEVSVGTVRNHKHRLYLKLNVTSEREIFSLFMQRVLGQSREPAPAG